MNGVWCCLKLMQSFGGLMAIAFVILGFFKVTPFSLDHGIHCIIIYALTMISINGVISLFNFQITYVMFEFVANLVATCLYIIVSLHVMYNAENNFYLLLLSKENENAYESSFIYSKWLSIICLICGLIHLIHFCFLVDYIFVQNETIFMSGSTIATSLPLRLYTCGSYVHTWLESFDWFREFERLRVATDII